MQSTCPKCGFDLSAPALTRVNLFTVSWGGSPSPWLGGYWSDLKELERSGYATRDVAGWWIPTEDYLKHARRTGWV